MAKFRKAAEDDPQQEEMTVVVLRLKGSSSTMQKSLDAVSQALAGMGAPQLTGQTRRHRELPNGNGTGAGAHGNGAGAGVAEPEEPEGNDDDAIDAEAQETPATPRAARGTAVPRKPKFLNDYDMNGDGTHWKKFAADLAPQVLADKYMVASLWLQKHGGLTTFTANHVYTLFQAMEWDILADFTQPMRHLKSKKNYFDTPERGKWKLNTHGLEVAGEIKAPPAP